MRIKKVNLADVEMVGFLTSHHSADGNFFVKANEWPLERGRVSKVLWIGNKWTSNDYDLFRVLYYSGGLAFTVLVIGRYKGT